MCVLAHILGYKCGKSPIYTMEGGGGGGGGGVRGFFEVRGLPAVCSQRYSDDPKITTTGIGCSVISSIPIAHIKSFKNP